MKGFKGDGMEIDNLRLKLEAANEMIASCKRDKCYCNGGLKLCMRCCMLHDLKIEVDNVKKGIINLGPRFEFIKDAIDEGYMEEHRFASPHKYPLKTEKKIITLKLCAVQVQKGHYDLMEIGDRL